MGAARAPRRMPRASIVRLFVPLFAVATLAACGGDSPTGNNGDDPNAAKVKTGTLLVTGEGLPNGITGQLRVSRGATSREFVTGTTQTLDPGEYTLAATVVTVDGQTYDPQPAAQSVVVTNNKLTNTSLTYVRRTGTVAVTVGGLPTGTNASVILVPPTGANLSVTGTTQLTSQTPGAWRFMASPVTANGFTYSPTPASAEGTLSTGATLAFDVQYAVTTGALAVAISGLPGSASGTVNITGPDGYARSVNTTTTITDLTPGSYNVSATNVVIDGVTWRAQPASQVVAITASTIATPAQITYAPVQATLVVGVIDAPQGATNLVQINGPNGFTRTTSTTATYTGLATGTYTITASPVTNAIGTFNASPASTQRVLSADQRDSVGVRYSITTGSLAIAVGGLPNGTNGAVTVTGPGGFTRQVAATQTISHLTPGTYTVTAANVSSGGNVYAPQTVTQQVGVAASMVAAGVTVTYSQQATIGTLAVNITGLPGDVNAAVTVSNGAITQQLTASALLQLAAGTYTISASNVTGTGINYAATPSTQNATVTVGNTTNATVTYAQVQSAGDDLSVEFAYVTQAVQRPDGSVALVANRDALLRVFVVNSRSNSLTPAVRARIYEGATLLQTVTLNAPQAQVPLTATENTLSSTWNTVIPAANVRVGMRILVDVDPSNSIQESDKTNNIWPRNGTPQTVTVVQVPTFNVRFVPVIVGALTGNVSEANKESYMVSLRRMFPVGNISSDVRLPFTSSATQLQANDGNGAWLTVLSEMNALRSADGAPSNLHYYGVLKVSYTSGIAGYGYVPGRAAIGWDHLPSGDAVAAHEWGHNFSRPHTPCGGVAGADPSYPYANGAVGMFGWNMTTGNLVQNTATDIMGYCSNQWISDWTWTRVLNYRQASGIEVAAATGSTSGSTAARGDGLLVWGRVSNGRVILEPAFRVDAAPTVAARGGTLRLEALDRRGNVITELAIEPQRVDHAKDSDEQQFAVVLPWSARLERSLANVRVRDVRNPTAAATRVSPAAQGVTRDDQTPVLPEAGEAVESAGSGRARVRWDQTRYPMAMARDAATGQIVAFLRRPGDEFVARNGRAVDIVFSDGVRSVVKRHQR